MDIESKLRKFLKMGKVFIGHTRDFTNERSFSAMLKNRQYSFREEKINGGSWFYHETKLSDHVKGVHGNMSEIDVMSLMIGLRNLK